MLYRGRARMKHNAGKAMLDPEEKDRAIVEAECKTFSVV